LIGIFADAVLFSQDIEGHPERQAFFAVLPLSQAFPEL
jgi:hypothetical protein